MRGWEDSINILLFFICGLLNDAAIRSDYTANDDSMNNKNEFERAWKEAVVA
jgi:hypothetical protein